MLNLITTPTGIRSAEGVAQPEKKPCWEAQSGVKEWEEIAVTGEANVLSGATAKNELIE